MDNYQLHQPPPPPQVDLSQLVQVAQANVQAIQTLQTTVQQVNRHEEQISTLFGFAQRQEVHQTIPVLQDSSYRIALWFMWWFARNFHHEPLFVCDGAEQWAPVVDVEEQAVREMQQHECMVNLSSDTLDSVLDYARGLVDDEDEYSALTLEKLRFARTAVANHVTSAEHPTYAALDNLIGTYEKRATRNPQLWYYDKENNEVVFSIVAFYCAAMSWIPQVALNDFHSTDKCVHFFNTLSKRRGRRFHPVYDKSNPMFDVMGIARPTTKTKQLKHFYTMDMDILRRALSNLHLFFESDGGEAYDLRRYQKLEPGTVYPRGAIRPMVDLTRWDSVLGSHRPWAISNKKTVMSGARKTRSAAAAAKKMKTMKRKRQVDEDVVDEGVVIVDISGNESP